MHPDDEETQAQTVQVDLDLEKRFTYHAPKGSSQVDRYAQIRNKAKTYAYEIKRMTPSSREQSLALTHLEEAVFWANAAIARNE
jgi:hypothetical protein